MIDAELKEELKLLVDDAFEKGETVKIISIAIIAAAHHSNPKSIRNIEEIIKTVFKKMTSKEIDEVRDVLENTNQNDDEETLSYFERLLREVK